MNPPLADGGSSPGLPDWRILVPADGVILEPVPDGQRLVLWIAGACDEGFRYWERVSNVPHTEFTVEPGIGAAAAVLLPTRQALGGVFGRLWRRVRGEGGKQTWLLPDGGVAEQCGDRRADILLVWAEADAMLLDAAWIKSRWPNASHWQQLGTGLFLVDGVDPPALEEELTRTGECPRRLAEQRLADARRGGDRRKEASALADLGTMSLHEGDAPRAIMLLEEALTIERELGDRRGECDVLGELGLAVLIAGQPRRALELIDLQLGYARESSDRFAEKMALERLGLACTKLPDPARALASFEGALVLAREVGDHKQEAELLWLIGIQQAESGRREEAIASAQASVDCLQEAGDLHSTWYADHLRRYRLNGEGKGFEAETVSPPAMPAEVVWTRGDAVEPWASPGDEGEASGGPSLLRLAFSAAKSMARFVGSGGRTVAGIVLQKRLRTCAACEHHTSLRCRLCGCFTNVKARLAHEECPIKKWTAWEER